MKIECVGAVERAIGRPITKAEAQGIEDRVRDTMRRLASKNPKGWSAMPLEGRMRLASEAIAKDLKHAADTNELRAALTVEAHMRHVPDIEAAGKDAFKLLYRKMRQAEIYIQGIGRDYLRQALDAIDYATRQDTGSLVMRGVRWISNLENPEKTLAFVREVFGKDSGDQGAKAAAKAWLEVVEATRQRFNAAGGDIRKLSYGYLPQPHDAARIRSAGIEAWVRDVMPMLDRSRYVSEAGRPLNERELADMLEEAFRTIESEGWNKVEPGQFRSEGALANAGSQARVLHFDSPEAYVQYLAKYGAGTVFDALSGHIGLMARQIGLVEHFGPNPNALFRTMHDTAKQVAGKELDKVARLWTTEDAWRLLTGQVDRVQNHSRAAFHQAVRNVMVFGKLGQALLSSITDVPTYFVELGFLRQNFWQGAVNLVRAFGSDARHFADVAGLVVESKIGDMRQFAEDRLGEAWTRGAADATMKASLLTAWTNGVRRAMEITLSAGMARLARTEWTALEHGDRHWLSQKGWTPEEWAVVQRATLERWKNTDMLTARSIAAIEGIDRSLRDRVTARLLGTLHDEGTMASLGPDLRTRLVTTGGLQKGTGNGELYRHLMLFKGYPFGMVLRHFERIHEGGMGPASKVAYTSSLLLGTTLFGALALQLKDIVAGRDPRDATGNQGEDPAAAGKFWLAALAQGGGLGIVGDLLVNAAGRQGQSLGSAAISSLAGPVYGSAFELGYDVGVENIREAAQGKETHAPAEAFRWARGHLPAINLWYSKLVIDQAALNQMQEFLSPGYLSRVKDRSRREWGTSYWWEPTGDEMEPPERAPDLSAAFGSQ